MKKLALAAALAASAFATSASALTFDLTTIPGDGSGTQSVDAGPLFGLSLTGNDNGVSDIVTAFTATATMDGTVEGAWFYETSDVDGAFWDPAGYFVNALFTPLTDDAGADVQSGLFSFAVMAGDDFGFYVESRDGILGTATATFVGSGPFVAPVPLPASLPLALVGLGGLAALRRRKKS